MRGRSKRKLSQETAKKQRRQEETNSKRTRKTKPTTNPRRKKTSLSNHERTKSGLFSGKPLFDTVIEGSDAESKVGQRLTGAPPWETQRGCTDELTGSDLVEHEKLGRHP